MKYLILFILFVIFWAYLKKSIKHNKTEDNKLVKCEQCSIYLPEEDAKKHTDWNEIHYFCSDTCEKKYLEEKQ